MRSRPEEGEAEIWALYGPTKGTIVKSSLGMYEQGRECSVG